MTDEIAQVQGSNSDSEVGYKKPPKAHQFVKGDKRINRNGRPKSFDQLRKLAQKISHEPIAEASQISVAEAILRTMAKENPARFVEIAFGKVPDKLEITQVDVDRAIEAELARVAARRQTKDAGDTEGANSIGENNTA